MSFEMLILNQKAQLNLLKDLGLWRKYRVIKDASSLGSREFEEELASFIENFTPEYAHKLALKSDDDDDRKENVDRRLVADYDTSYRMQEYCFCIHMHLCFAKGRLVWKTFGEYVKHTSCRSIIPCHTIAREIISEALEALA